MDVLTIRDRAIAALDGVGAIVTAGEVETVDGRIRNTVVVGTTTGVASARRAAGGSVNRDGYVNALVVGTSRDACLALSQRVRDTLSDLDLGSPHGRLTDASYDGEPLPEPDTSPARWSRALAFITTTKRSN